MINTEDEVIVDLRISCTKDEAVAKLLGWLKGPLHPKKIPITDEGLPEGQLVHLSTLEEPLETQLQELLEAARQALIKAAEADSSHEVLGEKHNDVDRIKELIQRAFFYMSELTDELSKDTGSGLKIDQEATKNTGQLHITLKSLNDWASNLFSITVLDDVNYFSASDAIKGEDDGDEDVPDDDDCSGMTTGLGKTKAKHLYVTLSFLIEGLMNQSKKNTARNFGSDKPNVDAISRYLAELAEALVDSQKKYQGQSSDAILKRIKQALRVREHHQKYL